jgi:uncharacterized protein (DUF433 family)
VQQYPHVEVAADGVARLSAHPRVRVAQIAMDYLSHGWSAEEMQRQHPYLSLSEIHAALAYYFDNQAEIDSQIRAEWTQVENDRAAAGASRIVLRLRAQGHP